MPTFEEIYTHHAADYDLLVAREDYQGNLLPALERIRPLAGTDVVEMGAGTGRLTRLLAPHVRSIRAYDGSPQMLAVAAKWLEAQHSHSMSLAAADNRALPALSASADVALAGWSFGHSVAWYPDTWRAEIGGMLDEMMRVLRPSGAAVILETFGTGSESPAPPTLGLAAYYRWLEAERGFQRTWIRTDYRFTSQEEAEHLTGFFFGAAMAQRVRAHHWVVLPECTGIWHRHL